jgi:hypothetical protein
MYSVRNTKEKGVVGNLCISLIISETIIFHVQNRFINRLPSHMVAVVADALGSGTGSHQRDGGGLFQTKPEKYGGNYSFIV